MLIIGHLCLLKVYIWSKVLGTPSNVKFKEVLAALHLQPSRAAGEILQLADGALKGLTRNRSCAELLYCSAILSLKCRVQGSTYCFDNTNADSIDKAAFCEQLDSGVGHSLA